MKNAAVLDGKSYWLIENTGTTDTSTLIHRSAIFHPAHLHLSKWTIRGGNKINSRSAPKCHVLPFRNSAIGWGGILFTFSWSGSYGSGGCPTFRVKYQTGNVWKANTESWPYGRRQRTANSGNGIYISSRGVPVHARKRTRSFQWRRPFNEMRYKR